MQFVIVAVPVGIGAFSEDFEVLLVGPIVVPKLMSSIETGTAGDIDVFHEGGCESTFAL